MFKTRKLAHSHKLIGSVLFFGSIALNSFPAYYEGIKEIQNEPVEVQTPGIVRRIGFYMLVAGGLWIWIVGRGGFPRIGLIL